MRPYLAVLKDSFREALASRVLWILIILTTLLLLLAAPVGIREQKVAQPPTPGTESDESSPTGKTEIVATYLVWDIFDPIPMSRAQATPVIKALLAGIIDFFVGTLGVFAAILVTASIIPHTFEAGAIDLLLSKPVSRSLLYLTKFFGGCAFIALNAGYFICGMWLIAGSRFDIWSGKLLLCIPVFLFLFSIYYCVSALAGVLWKNAVVSIVVTILFWALCFVVGATKNVTEQVWLNPQRLVKLVPAGDTLLGVTDLGQVRQWRPEASTWEDAFSAEGQVHAGPAFMLPQPPIGLVYDARNDRILAMQAAASGGGFGLFGPTATLLQGTRANGWKREKGPAPPTGVLTLLASAEGDVVAVTKAAVFRLVRSNADNDVAEKREKFVRSGPETALKLDSTAAFAMNPATGAIAIFNRGVVTVLELNSAEKYVLRVAKEVASAKAATAAVVAFGGNTVLVALADGQVLILDAADLSEKENVRPAGDGAPRFAAASPTGRWLSVLFHKHVLWLYDTQKGKAGGLSLTGQGDISAADFDSSDCLLATDRGTRVTRYQLDPFQVEDRRAPTLSGLQMVYHYVIVPIYTVFPKPGELGNVVSYLLTDQDSLPMGPNQQDLAQRRLKVDIAGPIWSSLVFLTVILSLSCVYVWRSDF